MVLTVIGTSIHAQGHIKNILSICWDAAGDYLVSVSEDSVKVWSFTSGNDGDRVNELNCSGNKFNSCVFHPNYPSLLVIGCYEASSLISYAVITYEAQVNPFCVDIFIVSVQSLELWDIREKNTVTISNAHDGLIAALAASNASGLVASVSHDKLVKLWK